MSKKCTALWREAHISKSECTTRTIPEALLEVEMSKKCTALWREAHISKSECTTRTIPEALLEVEMSKKRGRRKGFRTLPKVSKT